MAAYNLPLYKTNWIVLFCVDIYQISWCHSEYFLNDNGIITIYQSDQRNMQMKSLQWERVWKSIFALWQKEQQKIDGLICCGQRNNCRWWVELCVSEGLKCNLLMHINRVVSAWNGRELSCWIVSIKTERQRNNCRWWLELCVSRRQLKAWSATF